MADARTLAMALTSAEAELLQGAIDQDGILTIEGGFSQAACRSMQALQLLEHQEVVDARAEVFPDRWLPTDLGRQVAAMVGWA